MLALALIWIIFSFTTDGVFFSARNISNLMRQTAITGILATGMVLIIVAGHIDLSVGSIVGFTGGMAAMLNVWGGKMAAPWVILIVLLTGCLIGMLTGYLVAYRNIPAFIVTLAGLMIYRGLVKGFTGGETVGPLSDGFKIIGQDYLPKSIGYALMIMLLLMIAFIMIRTYAKRAKDAASRGLMMINLFVVAVIVSLFFVSLNNYQGVPIPVLVLIFFAAVVAFTGSMTPFGRHVYALGGNKEAAFYSGINVKKNVLLVFVIMGFLSAVAGIIYTARVGSATPDAGKILELDAIAACVIGGTSLMGGKGTIMGAMIGALIMASLNNGMSLMNIQDFMQDIIKGIILVVAVYMDVSGSKK